MRKYFDDPRHDAAFEQFITFLADMIEKYGGNIDFSDIQDDMSWESEISSVREENENNMLTTPMAA